MAALSSKAIDTTILEGRDYYITHAIALPVLKRASRDQDVLIFAEVIVVRRTVLRLERLLHYCYA